MADEHDPAAFAAKLKAWREEGCNVFSFSYSGGDRRTWREEPSVLQRERDHIAELRSAGTEFERYSG
jgi:hypothetical protein